MYSWSNVVEAFAMLFADDWWFSVAGRDFALHLLGAIFYLRVFSVPLSWKKLTGGFVLSWVGYELNSGSTPLESPCGEPRGLQAGSRRPWPTTG